MKLEKVKLAELSEPDWNYNKHPQHQIDELARSLDEFNQFKNIVVWRGLVIAGNGLVMAARKKGWSEISVLVRDDLTEEKAKALCMADNALPLLAEPDADVLKGLLTGIDEPFDIPGINQGWLDAMECDFVPGGFEDEPEPGDGTEDEIPEEAEPVCKLGDLWSLGDHRLFCGDCTDTKNVEILMDGEVAELLFTSPPYADMRDYGGCDLSIEKLKQFIQVFKDHARYQVINLGMKRKDYEIVEYWQEYIEAAKAAGYKFLSWNVWNRSGSGFSVANINAMFAVQHEFILVFGHEHKKLNKTIKNKMAGDIKRSVSDRQKDGSVLKKGDKLVGDKRQLGTVLSCFPQLARSEVSHPAMFPVELPEEYIKAMTDENDIVAEPFGGSGTTMIACEKTGRHCRMMEIDEKYSDIIIQRWEDYTGKKAVKL